MIDYTRWSVPPPQQTVSKHCQYGYPQISYKGKVTLHTQSLASGGRPTGSLPNILYFLKRSFFQAAVVSILLYGCTTWTLTKRLEKKLDGNYTRMLWAILNKSWRQHPTRHQLYGHLPPITKTIQVTRTRHARYCGRSRDELISDVLLWTSIYGRTKAGRPGRTYDVALKTCQRRWTIGRSGERGSGISVLAARHDDDDDGFRKSNCKRWEYRRITNGLLLKYFGKSIS